MRIIKHGHACLEFVEGEQRLILDPGFYTEPIDNRTGVTAIVLTHQHDDHTFEAQLDRILALNPNVPIFSPRDVCERLARNEDGARFHSVEVNHGDFHVAGPFTLEFFGAIHAEIHRSIPLIQNTGVLINGQVYYPGDSFTRPDRPVEVLACPSSAPWLKISEVMDFVADVKPRRCFPTHNIHLSSEGHQLNNGRMQQVVESNGGTFTYLEVGQELTV